MSNVCQILANRRAFYQNKLKTFLAWSTTKCSMNGTSDKFIRNMMTQMLKELHISSTLSSSIISTVYTRDFDATTLVNTISRTPGIFDVLSKDGTVRLRSVECALSALSACRVYTDGMSPVQLSGMCVFVQFILCGGRNELEGFGVSPDLIEKWKNNQKRRIQKERQQQMNEQAKCMQSKIVSTDDDIEEETVATMVQEVVPESWEDI